MSQAMGQLNRIYQAYVDTLRTIQDCNVKMNDGLDAQDPYLGQASVFTKVRVITDDNYVMNELLDICERAHVKAENEAAYKVVGRVKRTKRLMQKGASTKTSTLMDIMYDFAINSPRILRGNPMMFDVDMALLNRTIQIMLMYTKAYNGFKELRSASFTMAKNIKDGDYTDVDELETSVSNLIGAQNAAAEAAVEAILASLPRTEAATLRNHIDRSGCRLQALKKALRIRS